MSAKKEKLKQSSRRFAYTAGALNGLTIGAKSKVGIALKVAGRAAGVGSTVQNVRGSTGVGDFLKTEVANMFRAGLGAGGSFAATTGVNRGLKAIRRSGAPKKAGEAVRGLASKLPRKKTMKDVKG